MVKVKSSWLKSEWLGAAKYAVLILLVIWIWRSIRYDSSDANGMVENYQSLVENYQSLSTLKTGLEKMQETQSLQYSQSSQSSQCTSCETGVDSEGKKLLPVTDPCFNMREICKQCILLEDHLFQKQKNCDDCCRKHSLAIEALAEEAITLDKEQRYGFLCDLPEKLRSIQKECNDGADKATVAQKYRAIRKSLMPLCYDKFE